ncbi:MAG: BON domain-containing protein [Rhodoferax sp.]|nr:BON domain-containing protein [Rhodoferax sp.]
MRSTNVPTLLTSAVAVSIFLSISACSKAADPVAAPVATTSIGTKIDDSVLTANVLSAFVSSSDIKSLDLKVGTRKGEVQLSGFVESQAQMDRAIEVARAVPGVTGVQNNMGLKGAPRTVGVKVDDGIVTAGVKTALLADDKVRSFDIAVVTRKGEVQLSGFVDAQSQMDRAVMIARAVEGVSGVSNEMSIKK